MSFRASTWVHLRDTAPLPSQKGFNTRALLLSGCDWLRRVAAPAPLRLRHRGSVRGALRRWQRAALHTDKPGRGEAAVPARPSSIIAMGITTAFFLNQALIPYYLKPVHLETRTIKQCSWDCRCTRARLSFSPPVSWGGGWETSRDEKCFYRRQLGQGRLLDPHLYFLNQDHACHECVRSGESVTFYAPCLFLFFILRTRPAGSPLKGTVPVFFVTDWTSNQVSQIIS